MSAPEFVRTGWACVTETLCGPSVSLEGSTDADMEPVVFDTYAEADGERAQYIDLRLEALEHDADAEGGELAELLQIERESLEAEEGIAFVGVDAAGEVFELDPESREILRPLQRPDR
jgi:hypothetical protein